MDACAAAFLMVPKPHSQPCGGIGRGEGGARPPMMAKPKGERALGIEGLRAGRRGTEEIPGGGGGGPAALPSAPPSAQHGGKTDPPICREGRQVRRRVASEGGRGKWLVSERVQARGVVRSEGADLRAVKAGRSSREGRCGGEGEPEAEMEMPVA